MNIFGIEYIIMDSLEYITIADSFVLNKIGTGNGEAKLYVGNNTNERVMNFFSEDEMNGFCLKEDFKIFLNEAKEEFLFPQQNYQNKEEMPEKYKKLIVEFESEGGKILPFKFEKVDIKPPRVYIRAQNPKDAGYYKIRKLGLPNISYLSILKLKSKDREEIVYYFKMFVDYKPDIIGYYMPEEKKEEEKIKGNVKISSSKKETLLMSRIGQGKYREKLLEDCPFCPFTLVNDERLLIASHIKPWAKSSDLEKIDFKNGFIFTPTFDKLFDRGFISFSDDKKLIVSPWISPLNQRRLGIYNGKVISKLPIDDKRKEYLNYHRENIYKK